MAKARKTAQADLPAQRDPAAPLDAVAFLRAAQPVLRRLTDDLLVRADASPHVTAALKTKHTEARAQHRTAEDYVVWRRAVVTQVAAAWLLSCVFIRVLEDRGLIHARLAGAAASDSERTFFQFAPSLSHREYLLLTFRELTRLPAAADLFDSKHNLVWRLAPSDAACKELLQLFRGPSIEAPAFRFGQLDTRFLGDLYQDIDADTREFYALLQTPDFVESFILDHTLEPAIREYGIDNADLIDPTCGSGHFLLGAFPRFLDHLRRAHPAMDDRELARRALDKIFGVDINPYAASIARFRLFLKFVEVGQYRTLRETPRPPIHVVPADSLLYGFAGGQGDLSERDEKYGSDAFGEGFNLEDAKGARELLAGRTYTAVVGNPPYITVKDAALREKYRNRYTAAAGKYALSAPFMQRFFALGKGEGGFIGQITSNSFTKRDFGKTLIEKTLRELDVTYIVNTAGAYIPGHTTPTVLIFGRNRKLDPLAPRGTVLAVLAKRGEPSTPENPSEGLVWRSITAHGREITYEDDYISVEEIDRAGLDRHPWSLEGGGASQLKVTLEAHFPARLGPLTEDIGFASFTGLDEAFILPEKALSRQGIPKDLIRPMIIGESIRDWSLEISNAALCPYDQENQHPKDAITAKPLLQILWPLRTTCASVISFGGKTRGELGETWWHWYRWQPERYRAKYRITFAFVSTHNHFLLDRGGTAFSRSAPIITLTRDAADLEEKHQALVAYLNSSTACFWMKQVYYPKGTTTGDISTEKGRQEANRYEFAGKSLHNLPIPNQATFTELQAIASELERLQHARDALLPHATVARAIANQLDLASHVESSALQERVLVRRMVALQEDLDWVVYGAIDASAPPMQDATLGVSTIRLLSTGCIGRWTTNLELAPEQRPFYSDVGTNPPIHLGSADRNLWLARARAIQSSRHLRLIENPINKRPWTGARGVFGHKVASFEERCVTAAEEMIADIAESLLCSEPRVTTRRELQQALRDRPDYRILREYVVRHETQRDPLDYQLEHEAVPFVTGHTYSAAGFEKHLLWRETWNFQRLDDEYEQISESAPLSDPTDEIDQHQDLGLRLRQAIQAMEARDRVAAEQMRRWSISLHPDSDDIDRVQGLLQTALSPNPALTTPATVEKSLDALGAFVAFASRQATTRRARVFRLRIPVPPKFDPVDFRDGNTFRLRGKLDVPKERFISYPGCASDVDLEPVYGWAGWDHLQRALALFQLYYARKDEAWKPERLLPMLAGLEELLPWIRQWHAEARSPETGQLYHEYFDQVIASEAAEIGLSRAQLAIWAPPERGAGRKSAKPTPSSADDSDTDAPTPDGESPTPKRKPGRKPKAAASSDDSDTDAPATDGEPAAPKRKPGRKPKAAAATDGSDPAPARARKSKSADKTPPSASE